MAIKESVQLHILESIKQKLKPNISLADELAELLEISKDSAYRRIRAEKSLDIKEVQILANHFNLSLDNILKTDSDVISFDARVIGNKAYTFSDYLNSILDQLITINQIEIEDKILSYSARDLPIFHYFMIPELAAFKLFFWRKTYLNEASFSDAVFDLENLPVEVEELIPVSRQIWKSYAMVPSEEIWSIETVNVPLKQIQYCYETGQFAQPEQALLLIEKYQELISTIEKEARSGKKLISLEHNLEAGEVFNLYHNEVSLGDNSVLFRMGDKKMSFLTVSIKILMTTTTELFCNEMEVHHNNLKRKSTLLSNTSEKERLKLFARIREIINEYKNGLQ